MLDTLRNKKQGIIGFFVIAFAVMLMVSFGLDTYTGQSNRSSAAIRIDSEEISYNAFHREYNDLVSTYQRQFGQNFEMLKGMINFKQQAIDSLITDELLKRLFASLGMTASIRQIQERISSMPYFGGRLTSDSLRDYLRAVGTSSEAFEAEQRRDIVRQQFLTVLTDLARPSELELRRIYQDENATASFSFVAFAPDAYKSKVELTPQKVEEFYNRERERYRIPRRTRFQYVAFPADEFASKVEVTPEDLQALYEERQTQFVEPRQFHLREIVLKKVAKKEDATSMEEMFSGKKKSAGPESEAEKAENQALKTTAEGLVAKLKEGADFEKLAKETSQDKVSAAAGGDVGWKKFQDLDNDLREAVEKLEIGEFSGVIENEESFRIVRLDEVKESRQKPLDEVKADLEADVRHDMAPEFMAFAAEQYLDKLRGESSTFAEYAKANSREVKESPGLVGEKETPTGVPAEILARVHRFLQGDRELVQSERTNYVVEVTEVRDTEIPPLADVRAKVEKDCAEEEAKRLTKEAAKQFLTAAKEKGASEGAFVELAKSSGMTVEESKPGTVKEAAADFLGDDTSRRAVFSLSTEAPYPAAPVERGEKLYVVRLKERAPADEKNFETAKAQLAIQESQRGGLRIFTGLTETLRSQSDIWVNPDVLEGEV